MKLTYNTLRKSWADGLPIGNGRLAAMLWATDEKDILSFNHEWLWTGIHKERTYDNVSRHLSKLRNLLKQEQWEEATIMANKYWGGLGGISEIPDRIDDYQPAGDIILEYESPLEEAELELDISNGIFKQKRKRRTDYILMEAFISSCDDISVSHWKSHFPFSCRLRYKREKDERAVISISYNHNGITADGIFKGGISFQLKSTLITDGMVSNNENGIFIKNATQIVLFTDIETGEKTVSEKAFKLGDTDTLKKCHTEIFSGLMNRSSLNLPDDTIADYTDAAIKNARNGNISNGLLKLFYEYGRYLFLSCSILAELPLNLQGKWNHENYPPWGSDYHHDINLQMAYWAAEKIGFSEFVNPLTEYIIRLGTDGKVMAKNLYNCRGAVLPLASDAWAKTAPESCGWAVWIGAAAWLCQHLWQHYIYTGDKIYLKEKAYPFMNLVAEFYEDYLIKDDSGTYQIMPSQSPENAFHGSGDFPVSICVSSAMDVQLVFESFTNIICAAEILNTDYEKEKIWKEIINNLPPFSIGEDGRLLEWNKPFDEKEPEHRHLSHLYGIFPGDIFNEYEMPMQYEASKKSLDARLNAKGGQTGWSRSWIACLYAKYGEKDKFYEHYSKIITDFATESLLDLHPPHIFQIDGNIGAVAALTEAIVSVSGNKIRLLHALPKELSSKGSITGIHIPGGHVIDICWKHGIVKNIKVTFGYSENICFVANGKEFTVNGKNGENMNIVF